MYKVTPNIGPLESRLSRSLKVTVRSDTGAGSIELAESRVPHISDSWGTGGATQIRSSTPKNFQAFCAGKLCRLGLDKVQGVSAQLDTAHLVSAQMTRSCAPARP